ncbi:MAG: bifunctional nicotinamidase/pyrazinamidase [Spirochaetota bacterium]
MPEKALIIVDMQYDFLPGGSLAVESGDTIIGAINTMMKSFELNIATQDWHPKNHVSFASSHPGLSQMDTIEHQGSEQVLWPDHCVQGTRGAMLHEDLDPRPITLVVRKGFRSNLDSYSAFFENDRTTPTGLEGYLNTLGVRDLYVCGLATDYCVFFSAEDAKRIGYNVHLVTDATRGVGFPEGSVERALAQLKKTGVHMIDSHEVTG